MPSKERLNQLKALEKMKTMLREPGAYHVTATWHADPITEPVLVDIIEEDNDRRVRIMNAVSRFWWQLDRKYCHRQSSHFSEVKNHLKAFFPKSVIHLLRGLDQMLNAARNILPDARTTHFSNFTAPSVLLRGTS